MILPLYVLWNIFALCASTDDRYIVITAEEERQESYWPLKRDVRFAPTWSSLDSRPLPTWYDEAKFGIFIHWGVFSVPSFGSEWFWNNWQEEKGERTKYRDFMRQRYPPNFTYQDFARDFTAEFFNASQWSELFEASGAKYVVLTSKHHEGYTLWPSTYSFSWNSMDVGPRKDLVGELATAIKSSTKLKFGLYHSLYEWYNPMYLADKSSNFTTQTFVKQKILPELRELIERYEPEVIWSDGDWEAPDSYWKSTEFLAWLYNDSPVKNSVVANDRWGRNIPCHHGDFFTCTDRFNPGILQRHKWENCMTIDKRSWGFRRDAPLSEYLTLAELVKELIVTVSCGGNLLMNVGPTKDGVISPIFEERLRGMGDWLGINGEAIYNTKPWIAQNDTLSGNVWYTQSRDEQYIYTLIMDWPSDGIVHLESLKLQTDSVVTLLGFEPHINWKYEGNKLSIYLPAEAHTGQPAWVLKTKQKYNYKV